MVTPEPAEPREPVVPDPPSPFEPQEVILPEGHSLFRVHNRAHRPAQFNPGFGSRTRFAFFGDPPVPILYAADTEEAAIAESLLHDIQPAGGDLRREKYENRDLSLIVTTRELRLASFLGLGLRQLGVEATNLTATRPTAYRRTVKWAEAAHRADFDGVAYMSRLHNEVRAYAFFGDRVSEEDFGVTRDRTRSFNLVEDRDWLVDFCTPFRIEVQA